MQNTPNTSIFHQAIFRAGILLLALSFLVYLLPDLLPEIVVADGLGLFMIHYAFVVIYFFAVLFAGRFKRDRGGLPLVVITLLLFLISAYALNRQMDVFHASVGWVQVLLVVTSLNLLVASTGIEFSLPIKVLQVAILTIAAIFYGYLALYLVPIYAFGLLGGIAIGIGLHAFVPVLLLIYTLRILLSQINFAPVLRRAVGAVAAMVVLLIGLYAWQWAKVQRELEASYHSATRPDKTGWPAWVEALQTLPEGMIAGRILRSDLVYTVPNFEDGFNFFEAPRIRWEESKKHDPLVVLAAAFAGPLSIPKEDRIRMLQTIHDERFGAEERLWSGDNLETVHMNTEVQVWPAMHLAYAEKTITVAQRVSKHTWSGNQQEAIYIFQLPEGAVVTSLSLWIDGKEEKSVLTTKGKAVTAYRSIVGVERRDPSVVHWQEGNRVSVRIFPVLTNDQRIFKIGVTIPMPEREGKIWYEHFTFTGPSAENATENVKVRLMESKDDPIQTVALKRQQENTYTYEGKYNPELSLAIPAGPLQPHAFVFEGKAFRQQAYVPVKEMKHFTTICADINAAWLPEEWNQLLAAAKGKKLMVYDDGWVEIDNLNQREIFERLKARQITLFPFFEIRDAGNTLVVTKTSGKTPSLDDIRKSSGFDALASAASKGKLFYLYQIGEKPSLFISSLRELRLFHYAQGSVAELVTDLAKQQFEANLETANKVVIHNAAMEIEASDDLSLSNGPDHLLRLFAYNHIMQQGGLRLLADSSLEESSLADIASYAHIVTPVSSMIVLEKQEDYDRFGIDVNQEGLKNASAQNNGSVPEPHEWAIMIVCLLMLAYYRFQNKINLSWLKK